MGSLIVSNEPVVALPGGHPGRPSFIDPVDYGLPYYDRGIHLDDGAIFSVCALMPELRRRISMLPGVTDLRRHLRSMADVVSLARDFRADAVCIAAGDRTRFLTQDETISGDFGVLLRGQYHALPELYRHLAIMDEDVEHELAYALPHEMCGHVLFGGKSGDQLDEAWMWNELWAGNRDFRRAPEYAREAVYAVYDRIRERMPALAGALPSRPDEPGSYWFGVRPSAPRVVAEWLPAAATAGIPVMHIGGLGGSGFTITPAVVRDALRSRRPAADDDDQMSRII